MRLRSLTIFISKTCPKFTFLFRLIPYLFYLFSSDTLHLLMFVCPTNPELRFYGCRHSCFDMMHNSDLKSVSVAKIIPM